MCTEGYYHTRTVTIDRQVLCSEHIAEFAGNEIEAPVMAAAHHGQSHEGLPAMPEKVPSVTGTAFPTVDMGTVSLS